MPNNRSLKNILVTGCNGQLGYQLVRLGKRYGLPISPYDLPDIDITSKSSVGRAFEKAFPTVVVNAAAYTAVDRAETDKEVAYDVNSKGPALLADACANLNIPLIHISTDYVFDGRKKESYLETDPTSPIGVYGQSKADGEVKVRTHLARHLILRTAWLYDTSGQNFVKTMIRLGQERDEIKVVNDQYGCPTYAADLAEAILTIIKTFETKREISWGTFHYCGGGRTTWYQFARKIFEIVRQHIPLRVEKLMPTSTGEYPTAAMRPKNSVLSCDSIKTKFGVEQKPWDQSLDEMLRCLFADRQSNCIKDPKGTKGKRQ